MVFRKKGLLAVAVGSILGVASYNASATTFCIADADSRAGCGSSSTAIKFAKEIKADDSTKAYIPTGVAGAGTNGGFVNIVSPIKWGYASATEAREFFIRIDLLSGGASGKARFSQDADITLVLTGAAGNISANISLGANTAKNDAFVVFKVSTNNEVPLSAVAKFSLKPGIGIEASGKGNIEVVYSISNGEDVSPSNNTGTARATLIQFVDSYTFSGTGDTVKATSDVESNFLKFSGDKLTDRIARFNLSKVSDVKVRGTNESFDDVTLTTIFDTGEGKTTIDVLGDFTMVEDSPAGSERYTNAKPRVYLSPVTVGATCSEGGKTSAIAVTATSAKFPIPTTENQNGYDVCVSANGESAIPVGNYSVVLNPVGKNNRDTNTQGAVYDVSGEVTLSDLGSIVRNGTQLITPYMTTLSGYLSRVMLSNYGSRDITYKVELVTDEGGNATAGVAATGTVKAGTLKQINASELVAFSGKPRGAAIFTFVGASSDIQGIYQTVNLNTFDAQSVVMRRPGAGRGIQ
jgi:hypothetical protein